VVTSMVASLNAGEMVTAGHGFKPDRSGRIAA
jgi:hypothetical protein